MTAVLTCGSTASFSDASATGSATVGTMGVVVVIVVIVVPLSLLKDILLNAFSEVLHADDVPLERQPIEELVGSKLFYSTLTPETRTTKGDKHPDTLSSLANLALMMMNQVNSRKAFCLHHSRTDR